MSEHHPYDKWLGDKLSKLPVPDADRSWPEMRKLLDEEMPEGGGYSKRRGGWWFFGAVLIFIIAGSWTLLTMNFSRQNVDPPLSNTHNSSPPGGISPDQSIQSEKPVANDDKILHSSVQGDKTATNGIDGEPLNRGVESESFKSAGVQSGGVQSGGVQSVVKNGADQTPVATADEFVIGPVTPATNILPGSVAGSMANSNRKSSGKTNKSPAREISGAGDPQSASIYEPVNSSNNKSAGRSSADGSGSNRSTAADPIAPGDRGPLEAAAGDDGDAIKYAQINKVLPIPVGSVALRYDTVSSIHSDTMEYAYVSRKFYRQHKKYGTPANVKPPYSTFGRSFAIGLSLPLGFPLGDQKMLGYNINAGGNTASDYLPSPHIQYHFNGKSYIQTEFQLVSPQFIRPVLLYQAHSSNSNYSTTSSVYARKLYYFNVPVSVHYSPFRHFYMGTGLQFSSLLSGVALHEKLRTGMVSSDSIYTTRYAKFSNDSLSRKLNGSEMRLLLDANYYWHRFTVGLRYTQALSNYVNTRAAPAAPYSLDKNKSLQFYMRYNLWEQKRWNTRNRRLLPLK